MHESVQPNINQHTLPQQPLQVPLCEIDHVELLDEPLLVPAYNECDIFLARRITAELCQRYLFFPLVINSRLQSKFADLFHHLKLLDFYSASSLTQQSADRHVAPIGHCALV